MYLSIDYQESDRFERRFIQLMNWVDGISICNEIDGECCPDFSCCNKKILDSTTQENRMAFAKSYLRQHKAEVRELKFKQLGI